MPITLRLVRFWSGSGGSAVETHRLSVPKQGVRSNHLRRLATHCSTDFLAQSSAARWCFSEDPSESHLGKDVCCIFSWEKRETECAEERPWLNADGAPGVCV